MAKNRVVVENVLGQPVQRLRREEAARLVSRGAAAWIGGRLRLVQRFDGGDLTRRTAPTITHRQLERAAEGGFNLRAHGAAGYHARRIHLWPGIGDDRAVLAGGRA